VRADEPSLFIQHEREVEIDFQRHLWEATWGPRFEAAKQMLRELTHEFARRWVNHLAREIERKGAKRKQAARSRCGYKPRRV
jgi:hypothetical protein